MARKMLAPYYCGPPNTALAVLSITGLVRGDAEAQVRPAVFPSPPPVTEITERQPARVFNIAQFAGIFPF